MNSPSPSPRLPVRLGFHDGQSMFDTVNGLHDDSAGLSVIAGGTGGAADPLVMFEEHGTGAPCLYFNVNPDGVLAPGLNPNIHSPGLRSMLGDPDQRRNWWALRGIFGQEDPVYVNQVLGDLRQQLGTGGLAPIVEVTRRFQRRMALFRMLASARAQPTRPLDQIASQPHSLDHHAGGAHIFPTYLYEPLVLMASPFARGVVAARGIQESSQIALLVLMGATGEGVLVQTEEITWASVFEADLPALRKLSANGTTWMRKTNHAIVNVDARTLIVWWTQKLTRLFTEVTDLGRYRGNDDLLDAGRAYRELATLERVIANCVRIQARPTDHLNRVLLAFEFFDLLPNLATSRIEPGHVWERLANPANAKKVLHGAFAHAPAEIRKCFRTRTTAVLSRLREETLEGVLPGLTRGKRVFVGGKPYANDTFISSLLHQFRNTHHGYELDESAKTDLLDAHTGHISEAFPELVVLLTIALICDPVGALDGGWL